MLQNGEEHLKFPEAQSLEISLFETQAPISLNTCASSAHMQFAECRCISSTAVLLHADTQVTGTVFVLISSTCQNQLQWK